MKQSEEVLLPIRTAIVRARGLRCKVAPVDDWLSGDIIENVIGALEQECSKRRI